MLYNLVLKTKS